MQGYVFLYLLPPPQLWPTVVYGGLELEVLFALLCFIVPNGLFFHLNFGFHNIQWQKLPQLKKTCGKTAVWKKPFFWHIPYLCLTILKVALPALM